MIDGFIFYGSFYDALSDLPDGLRLQAYDAICKYALMGEEPENGGVITTIFKLIKPLIDANNKRREAGRKGGKAYSKQSASEAEAKTSKAEASASKSKQQASTPQPNRNEKCKKENEKEEVKEKKFKPPSVEEVAAYCVERGNNVDADRFVDFYAAKGWKVGNQPMKDWRACVRTWEKRDNEHKESSQQKQKNAFNRFDQREYDESELEQMLLSGVS